MTKLLALMDYMYAITPAATSWYMHQLQQTVKLKNIY